MTPSEKKLTEQIQRLSETLDHVGAYVFTKDQQGRYTYANKMVCDLFESPLNEIIGLTDSAFFDLSTFNQLQINDRRVLDHGEHIESEENNIIIASGELRTYWSVKKPIKNDRGQIIGMCGISTDITDRLKLEEDLLTANQTKDKLFSIIAHDIKGPIGFILGLFDASLLNKNNHKPSELYSAIYNSLNNIHKLLGNLLYWARSQKGALKPKKIEFEIEPHLKDSQHAFNVEINNKNITFTVNIAPALTVNADLFMFQTIIRNLLHNAIKFTPQNGTISVTAERVDNHILISITDTGIGIATAVAETLFTPLKNQPLQNEDLITKDTGLGLIICKEFVTLHSGTIGVSSALNKGSRFWFTLPKNT